MPRQRRRSSGLGADPRGDTGASALSTLEPPPTFNSPPLTPVCPCRTDIPILLLTLFPSAILKRKLLALFPNGGKPSLSSGDGKPFLFGTPGSIHSLSSSLSSPPMPSIQPLQILFTAQSSCPTRSLPTTLSSPTTPGLTMM